MTFLKKFNNLIIFTQKSTSS